MKKKPTKQDKIIEATERFIKLMERTYKAEIKYNIEDITFNGKRKEK